MEAWQHTLYRIAGPALDGSLSKALEELTPEPQADVMRLLVVSHLDRSLESAIVQNNVDTLLAPIRRLGAVALDEGLGLANVMTQ